MEKWIRSRFLPGTGLGPDGQRLTASKEHISLSKNAAKEGMVLLKNEKNVLPFRKGTRLALFGKGIFDYVKGGGGSGDVTVAYTRNLYEGLSLQNDLVEIEPTTAAYYRKETARQYEEGTDPGFCIEPDLPSDLLKTARCFTDTAVIAISRFSGEGWDRKEKKGEKIELLGEGADMIKRSERVFDNGDFYLTSAEAAMVEKVKETFEKVVVVLNVGGIVDSEWFCREDRIQGVLLAWQGGMEGGLAAAELLVGRGNPSGKLSDTFAKELSDYPSTEHFHDSQSYVDYTEDIYVGYRYFETIPGMAERVNYPFGFGLSYTDFSREIKWMKFTEDLVEVSAAVTNTGSIEGKEVLQLYYSAPQGRLGKPAKVLGAYQKTRLLKPGETQIINLSIPTAQMASYDDTGKVAKSAWVLEAGAYRFFLGTSVRDGIYLSAPVFTMQDGSSRPGTLTLKETRIVCQLTERMAPANLAKRLLSDGSYEDLPQRTPNDPDESIFDPIEKGSDLYLVPEDKYRPSYVRKAAPAKPQLIQVVQGELTLDEFVKALPDKELCELLGGQPNTGVANTYGIGNLPEYGVPNVMTADGPAGLRIQPVCGVCTTAWPCATLLACTWNPDMAEAVGNAAGLEVKENNIAVWLAPAVNIHRSPLCGRNFEYYSEDPYLAGRQAAALVRGVQSNHVGTSVKHFALNNKETNRKDCDSRASERAIREIYLKAFEIVVKESDPWTIMSSYNIINGHRASENHDLLTGILREEWGYQGMVTTDWWTYGEHYKEAKAGNDLKMACGYTKKLLIALEKGAVTREELETNARRILALILKVD